MIKIVLIIFSIIFLLTDIVLVIVSQTKEKKEKWQITQDSICVCLFFSFLLATVSTGYVIVLSKNSEEFLLGIVGFAFVFCGFFLYTFTSFIPSKKELEERRANKIINACLNEAFKESFRI